MIWPFFPRKVLENYKVTFSKYCGIFAKNNRCALSENTFLVEPSEESLWGLCVRRG